MNKEKLINEFIDNSIKIGQLLYEGVTLEYKVSNKLTDRNIDIYVKLVEMGFKDEFEKLLDSDEKYVRSIVSTILLNSGNHEKALSVAKKIANDNDKHGISMKDYLERVKAGKIDIQIWNDFLEKSKKKINNIKKDDLNDIKLSNSKEFEIPIFSNNKSKEINDYFKKNYDDCKIITIEDEDPINKHIPISINILTSKDNPFYTVYTTGMSSFNMNVTKTMFNKYKRFKLAELVIIVPLEWGNDFKIEKWRSLFKLLKELATYPHLNNTWINDGHTLEINMDYLNENFKAVVLCAIEIKGKKIIVNKENIVLNMVVPLYKEELDYVFKNGYNKILEKISENQESPFLLNLERKCSIK